MELPGLGWLLAWSLTGWSGTRAVGIRWLRPIGHWRVARTLLFAFVTWSALGGRSLAEAGRQLAGAVRDRSLEAARRLAPTLVGRDPEGLDGPELCRAAVESLAENTADAVVGSLLWGVLAGPPGVAAYRAANTLDAMVGHHSAVTSGSAGPAPAWGRD